MTLIVLPHPQPYIPKHPNRASLEAPSFLGYLRICLWNLGFFLQLWAGPLSHFFPKFPSSQPYPSGEPGCEPQLCGLGQVMSLLLSLSLPSIEMGLRIPPS